MTYKNPFGTLEDYPKEGPPVPEREKVRREKDRHESGTGRRDVAKKDGRGPGNWGDDVDDFNKRREEKPEPQESADGDAEEKEPQKSKGPPPRMAADFLSSSDSDEETVVTAKKVPKVDARFQKYLAKPTKAKPKIKEEKEVEYVTGQLDAQECIKAANERSFANRDRDFRGRGRGGRGRGRGGFRRGGRREDFEYSVRTEADGEDSNSGRRQGGHDRSEGRGRDGQ